MEDQARRLYRSRKERMIAGVCGGLAEYLAIDPVVVRLVFVLLALLNGVGIIAYIIAWIIIPEQPAEQVAAETGPAAEAPPGEETIGDRLVGAAKDFGERAKEKGATLEGTQRGRVLGGLILVLLGLFFLAREVFPALDLGRLWPVVFIVLGLILLFNAFRTEKH